jgi:hypothetical protein
MHNKMYVSRSNKAFKRGFTASQGGLSGSSPEILQQAKEDCLDRVHSDQMVLRTVRREAGPCERWPKVLNTKLAHGGHQIQVHSDKMVLVMARQEARPHERWPKTLKGQLENNSRKPRDLVRTV